MRQQEGLTIVEALENLNILSDIDSLDELEVSEKSVLISHKAEKEGVSEGKETYWVHAGPDDRTVIAIRETFKSIYSYLHISYEKMKSGADPKRLIEGINTIMVLVGETAKKLERFGILFKKITELNEYKKLENFYRNQVIKGSYKEFMKLSIPEVPPGLNEEQILLEEELTKLLPAEEKGVYPLNDLEIVKKDTDYELFYLKNEDGRNFYTYDLARNIKLACDFGTFQEEYFGDDPLLQVKNWIDKNQQTTAQRIREFAKVPIRKFYQEAFRFKNLDLVLTLHKALMALMLASNPQNLIRQFSLKGCYSYFKDFQMFLREAIATREYQKLIIYSAPASQLFFVNIIDLIDTLSMGLFLLGGDKREILTVLKELNHRDKKEETEKEHLLSVFLQKRNRVIQEALKKHPSGPIFKAVDLVREEEERRFDPLIQENLPEPEYTFTYDEKEMILTRMPSPTIQEFITRAEIAEEFKEFLRGLQNNKKHHLMFNLQDRTSWKEHARAFAIEDLSRHAQFDVSLTAITLAINSDFYHQMGVYSDLSDVQEFISQFLAHVSDEVSGYYYAPKIKKLLFPQFIEEVVKRVHTHFFGKKENLNIDERCAFIDICYLLMELKILEIVHPSSFSFVTKDGLDISAVNNVALIAFIGLNSGKSFDEKEKLQIERILFGPTLLHRERGIFKERFHRLFHILKTLEAKAGKKGELLLPFSDLFSKIHTFL